jgi:hypothetical protein
MPPYSERDAAIKRFPSYRVLQILIDPVGGITIGLLMGAWDFDMLKGGGGVRQTRALA